MTLEMKKILLYIVFLMCFPLSANSQVSGKKFSLDNGFVNGEHRIAELVTEKNSDTTFRKHHFRTSKR